MKRTTLVFCGAAAANLARGGTPGTAFVVWDSLDDLSFEEPLKLGFSIILR